MRVIRVSGAALVVGALVACGPVHRAKAPLSPNGDLVYTADDIAKMQVSTAWDVVQHTGMMDMSEASDGSAATVKRRRGQNSIILAGADTPMLFVDGVRTADARVLQGIPAVSIETLRVVNGIQATVRKGTDAGAGIIDIITKSGRDTP